MRVWLPTCRLWAVPSGRPRSPRYRSLNRHRYRGRSPRPGRSRYRYRCRFRCRFRCPGRSRYRRYLRWCRSWCPPGFGSWCRRNRHARRCDDGQSEDGQAELSHVHDPFVLGRLCSTDFSPASLRLWSLMVRARHVSIKGDDHRLATTRDSGQLKETRARQDSTGAPPPQRCTYFQPVTAMIRMAIIQTA